MNIKRIAAVILLFLAIAFFVTEIFLTLRESKVLASKNSEISQQLEALSAQKSKITQDLEYYSNPLNLQKLLREKFNYKLPGEKMIIVVPGQ
jgi:hypothetical protein